MKKSILLMTCFLFMILLPVNVKAGAGGHGGGVHYCLHADVVKVEFYDLYEGREVHELIINKSNNESVDDLLKVAISKVSLTRPILARKIREKVVYFNENKKPKKNKVLDLIKDANKIFIDENCEYKQLANWHDQIGKIFIDFELYNLLESNVDKSAFIFHEAIYAVSRDSFGESLMNSDNVRKFTAEVFSDMPMQDIKTEVSHVKDNAPGIIINWHKFFDKMKIIKLMKQNDPIDLRNKNSYIHVLDKIIFDTSFLGLNCKKDAKIEIEVTNFNQFPKGIYVQVGIEEIKLNPLKKVHSFDATGSSMDLFLEWEKWDELEVDQDGFVVAKIAPTFRMTVSSQLCNESYDIDLAFFYMTGTFHASINIL